MEIKTKELLDYLGLKYIEQYKLKRKYYDFCLPEYKILIECDGDYWHSFDRAKKNDIQKNKIAIDNGFDILRFTEMEINEDIDGVKNVIKEYVEIATARLKHWSENA